MPPLLAALKQQQQQPGCPSCCCSAERNTRLLDRDVYRQTQRVINCFWRQTFPFNGYCCVMCLSVFYILLTFSVLFSTALTHDILLCVRWAPWRSLLADWQRGVDMPARNGDNLINKRASWACSQPAAPESHRHESLESARWAVGCALADPHFLGHVPLRARKRISLPGNQRAGDIGDSLPAAAWPKPKYL